MIVSYETFEIRLESLTGGNRQLRIRSPMGSASVRLDEEKVRSLAPALRSIEVSSPLDGEHGFRGQEVRDLVWVTGQQSKVSDEENAALETGRSLYDLIFSQEVEQLLDRSLDQLSDAPQRGLCLRFHFDLGDPAQAELANLPWELLFRDSTQRFLAQSIETPVVRYLDFPGKMRRFVLPERLGVLLVIAQPLDLPPLSGLMQEVDRISTSWEQDNVTVTMLRHESGDLEDLGFRLREMLRKSEFHVLHFMGHGTFDEGVGEGSLYLETAERQALQVRGEDLANWLVNHRSLRLVVLNACSTGRWTDERPFAGVAPALVRAGIPGVLAMQAPMPDSKAVQFGRVFYHQIADGAPVEAALSEARLELHSSDMQQSAAWSTPILYQRTPTIVEVPPKIGPALAYWWTALSSFHLLWVGLMFLRNRSLVPGLNRLLNGDVAAFLGVFFGLPFAFASFYCALEYAKTKKSELPPGQIPWWRRIAVRLPVAFRTRVQGRSRNETTYQMAFLLLFVIVPMVLQGYLFVRMLNADIWLRQEKELYATTWHENLFRYVPPERAILGDFYRLGSIDDRVNVAKFINNVTYFPFWEPWGLLIVESGAMAVALLLLWRLFRKGSLARGVALRS